MEAASTEPEPPDARRWPAWYGIAAVVAGVLGSVVVGILVIVVFAAAGADIEDEPPSLVFTLALVQDACWVYAVLWFAAKVRSPRAAQFGIRATRFWPALGWATLAIATSYLVAFIYVKAFDVHVEQSTLKDLGAGSGALLTALIGVLVVGIAPAIEEFVFRGFLYGTLRNGFSFVPAALIDGLIFGGIHVTTGPSAVPPLIVFGFLLCLVYEATGSILPTIALHAVNNMVAFGTDKDGSWAVGAVVATLVVSATVVIGANTRRPVARTT